MKQCARLAWTTHEPARAAERESDGDEARGQRACHARITNVYRAHTRYLSNYKHWLNKCLLNYLKHMTWWIIFLTRRWSYNKANATQMGRNRFNYTRDHAKQRGDERELHADQHVTTCKTRARTTCDATRANTRMTHELYARTTRQRRASHVQTARRQHANITRL
jgi:hypothetical protein